MKVSGGEWHYIAGVAFFDLSIRFCLSLPPICNRHSARGSELRGCRDLLLPVTQSLTPSRSKSRPPCHAMPWCHVTRLHAYSMLLACTAAEPVAWHCTSTRPPEYETSSVCGRHEPDEGHAIGIHGGAVGTLLQHKDNPLALQRAPSIKGSSSWSVTHLDPASGSEPPPCQHRHTSSL